MTVPVHDVLLFVGPNALQVDVWDRYDITLSMLGVGNPWTFSFWHSDTAHSTWDLLMGPTGPKVGDLVTMSIDGDTILTGAVEVREVGDASDAGREGVAMVLSGRDLAGPAISFDADPTLSVRGQPLDTTLTRLLAGVGLTVEVSEHVDPVATTGALRVPRTIHARQTSRRQRLDLAHPHVGEKAWSVVERLVRRLGYRAWVAPGPQSGRCAVVVDVPNTTGALLWDLRRVLQDGRVTADSNILSGKSRTSIRDVPTTVTVFSDSMRGENASARQARTVVNDRLTNPAITRGEVAATLGPQPRYVRSETARTDTGAQAEGLRAIVEAMEHFRGYQLTTRGHGQGGVIYAPNTRGTVRDDLAGVNETMLLTDVTFSGGRSVGQHARLSFVPDGALSTIPVPA